MGVVVTALLSVGARLPSHAGDLEETGPPTANTASGRAPVLGLGVSLGAGSMSVTGEREYSVVAGLVARIGLDSRNRFQLMGEFQPMSVSSPIIDEGFRAFNVAAGYTFGREVQVRPVIGMQFRAWSGSERVEASDVGLLVGVDLGRELQMSDAVSLSPELVLRWSLIEFEGSVSSSFVGLQCVVSWRRR